MNDEFNNPFEKLKKAKLDLPDAADARAKSTRPKAGPKPPPQPAAIQYHDEDDLFLRAMSGAEAMQSKHRKALQEAEGDVTFGELLEQEERRRNGQTEVPKPAPKAPEPKPATPAVNPEVVAIHVQDDELFMQAMGAVAPVEAKGRDVPKETIPPEPAKEKTHEALTQEHLRDLVRGEIDFQLEFTTEYQHGHVDGLDPKIFNKLRAGAYANEAHLDLHGMNADQALVATVDFIRKSYTLGKRNLIIVTGRGKNSPDGRGILRNEVQTWLTREPLRRVVLAFVTAQPRDGGPGALYVLLRKFKKSLGKVQWDRIPKDWSLYD